MQVSPAASLFCVRPHSERSTTVSFRRAVRVFRTIRYLGTSEDISCAAGIVHHPRLLRYLISLAGQGNWILLNYLLGRLPETSDQPLTLPAPLTDLPFMPCLAPAPDLSIHTQRLPPSGRHPLTANDRRGLPLSQLRVKGIQLGQNLVPGEMMSDKLASRLSKSASAIAAGRLIAQEGQDRVGK